MSRTDADVIMSVKLRVTIYKIFGKNFRNLSGFIREY
jgi:hypothetical protein